MSELRKEVEEFVLEYLSNSSDLSEVEHSETLNFVDSGMLDSFGILSMIMDVESRFSIKLTAESLMQQEAKTVAGFASLVVDQMEQHAK